MILGGHNSDAVLWDATTARIAGHISIRNGKLPITEEALAIGFSGDGTKALAAGYNGTVIVWNPQTGSSIRN